jgi:hypothetical protein
LANGDLAVFRMLASQAFRPDNFYQRSGGKGKSGKNTDQLSNRPVPFRCKWVNGIRTVIPDGHQYTVTILPEGENTITLRCLPGAMVFLIHVFVKNILKRFLVCEMWDQVISSSLDKTRLAPPVAVRGMERMPKIRQKVILSKPELLISSERGW